jgi:hypothetical protein
VIRFAGQDPGIKYPKMLAIQDIEVITRRIDHAAAEAVQAGDIESYIEAYRRRKPDSR